MSGHEGDRGMGKELERCGSRGLERMGDARAAAWVLGADPVLRGLHEAGERRREAARVPERKEEALQKAPHGWTSSVEKEAWTTLESRAPRVESGEGTQPWGGAVPFFLCHRRESRYVGKNALRWEEWVMPFEGFWISLRDGEKPAAGCEEVGCQFEKERQVRQSTWQEAHLAGIGEVEPGPLAGAL